MNTITVALIVAFGTTAGPIFLAYLTNNQRRQEKLEDWRRQDEVAARLLAATKHTDEVLDTIHTLVNSNMTAAMQSDLNSMKAQLALMKQVFRLTGKVAQDPSIEVVEARIAELTSQLEDRQKAQERAERKLDGG
jgi:predicted RNase H-like nuclease (RuvC/YqgF family)